MLSITTMATIVTIGHYPRGVTVPTLINKKEKKET